MRICKICGIDDTLNEFCKGNNICKACRREYTREYNAKNRDKRLEYNRKYHVENIDRIKEYNRKHYAESKDKIKEYGRKHYAENKDKKREQCRAYRANNKDKVNALTSKYRTMAYNNGGSHTAEEWNDILARCNYTCLCCGRNDVKLEKDHIRAINKGGTDYANNLQPLCRPCNSKKHDKCIDYRPLADIFKYQVVFSKAERFIGYNLRGNNNNTV